MRRCVDQLIALIASAVLAIVALAVRNQMGPPVLFRQERAGLHGKPFTMFKFRTMADERDSTGALLPDAERLPPFGRLLRSTSLDELPELWNVVRGEMALVGPRPLPVAYLDRYPAEEARRHEVRPGITRWAQVNSRNTSSRARSVLSCSAPRMRSWCSASSVDASSA
jgi:sugar transferase EpsL